jgi:hypothetical protein
MCDLGFHERDPENPQREPRQLLESDLLRVPHGLAQPCGQTNGVTLRTTFFLGALALTSSAFGSTEMLIEGACPGEVSIEITGEPGSRFVLIMGDKAREPAVIPGGRCAGTDLAVEAPGALTKLGPLPDLDGDGRISLNPVLPDALCGKALQVLNLDDCTTRAAGLPIEDVVIPVSDSCREVAGNMWCFHPSECGIACEETCRANDMTVSLDEERWFEAQNTAEECQPIADAFGATLPVEVSGWTYTCVTDGHSTDHTGLEDTINTSTAWACSTTPGCPRDIRTNMDQLGVPCGPDSRKTICLCE